MVDKLELNKEKSLMDEEKNAIVNINNDTNRANFIERINELINI